MKERIGNLIKGRIRISSQVAGDLFTTQFKWALWYIAVITLLHVFVSLFSEQGVFVLSYGSTPTYMLVIGFVVGTFMPFYVKHGVTRKDYYLGSALAMLGVALAIALIFSILAAIESAVYHVMALDILREPFNLSGGSNNWFSAILIYSLSSYLYCLIGWFVYLGFYRFTRVTGLGFCLLAFLLIYLHGFLENAQLVILGLVVLIGILLYLIRLLTQRIPIKI